jgi:hypothetical protein
VIPGAMALLANRTTRNRGGATPANGETVACDGKNRRRGRWPIAPARRSPPKWVENPIPLGAEGLSKIRSRILGRILGLTRWLRDVRQIEDGAQFLSALYGCAFRVNRYDCDPAKGLAPGAGGCCVQQGSALTAYFEFDVKDEGTLDFDEAFEAFFSGL